MSRLRIGLPPLDSLLGSETPEQCLVDFARLDRGGRTTATGRCALQQLGRAGQGGKPPMLECFLHPQDSLLTCIELPQLPAARIKAAVACAAQALILGPSEAMHVAHGPRDAQGQVALSWLPRERLQALGRVLERAGLVLSGLYPAPYALPVPPPGQLSVCLLDEQLLVRHSATQGSVQPLMAETLEQLHASGSPLCWVGDAPALAGPQPPPQGPVPQRFSGTPPAWGLHGAALAGHSAPRGWGRALGCCALAVAVWVLGLNLYAAREAEQGQRLKTQMSQRVKQVFPELPVVLNPLQQARQQLAARQSGAAAGSAQGFAHLLSQAGLAMPFMVGSVQSLSFADERLQLELLPDAVKTTDSAWQGALAQAGYSAQAQGNGWALSPGAAATVENADEATGDEHE
ncbi:type II secretion system protein GspL [Pseudomonas sp. Au-Pse12]|uniref:type II secretion system protein GspL n=1 Tax=Pseudomonas sp. Au-Pse12 TaxID=2906459 RepID=UPI001E557300|nr:type II secretion system protein GspL [Pseudomonas sp. Au-Pse12]MCE4053113.1 type II secretion system protein GspL [Pseudomonas sp. Au-Pse12]